MKMATNGIAYFSHWFLGSITLIDLFVVGIMATDPMNVGLNDFDWSLSEKSTTPSYRERPKWETSGGDANSPEDMADEKSKWPEEMEEISLRAGEKWEKYRTRSENSESSDATGTEMTLSENSGEKMPIDAAGSKAAKISGKNVQLKIFREISGVRRSGENKNYKVDQFTRVNNNLRNGRWGMSKKHEPSSKQLSPESREVIRRAETPEEEKADFSNRAKIFNGDKESAEIRAGELWGLGNRGESKNRSKKIGNGRWGMSGGNEPPLEVKEEILGRKMTKNNKKDEETEAAGRRGEIKIDQLIAENIWNGRWGMSEKKVPEKFFEDVILRGKNPGVEKHNDRLKSPRLRQEDEKSFITESGNEEYFPKASYPENNNYRRTLSTGSGLAEPEKDEKIQDSTPRSTAAGIPQLIQIIISPYVEQGDNENRMELSIDKLIPGINGASSVIIERQPIVIGLLDKKICDKLYKN